MISPTPLRLNCRRSCLALLGVLLGLSLTSNANAQVVTWFWVATGTGTTDNYSDTANWSGGVVPTNDGTARLQLPWATGPERVVLPNGALALDSLYLAFDNNAYYGTSYRFSSAGTTTLSLAAGINSPNNGYSRVIQFDSAVAINLTADQTWTTSYNQVDGAIGGPGKLTISPHYYYQSSYLNQGYLQLNGPGNFTGGLSVYNTTLTLGHAQALDGSGTVSLSNVRLETPLILDLNRALTVSGTIGHYRSGDNGRITFSGPITLMGSTTFENMDYSGATGFLPMVISGNIGESAETPEASLGLNGGGIVLSGTNSYTGDTHVNGRAIFATAQAVAPTTTIFGGDEGYAGVAFTSGVQAGFINHISSESFNGTIGFDTIAAGPSQVFTENLDLSGLNQYLGLGTMTSAVIAGTINPGEGNDYRFGLGGGLLAVTSALTGERRVLINSIGYHTPTTVVLHGNNTFSGGVEVNGGAVVFATAGALPATGSVKLTAIGSALNLAYAGITEGAGLTPAEFLARLDLRAPQAILGFDSAVSTSPRTITDTIDLSLGQQEGAPRTSPYFLGTTTKVILAGTITTGGGSVPLQLTGFKGGELIVDSTLGAVIPSVVIGLPDNAGVGGLSGTVRLTGANTYAGGTTFQSGILALEHDSALGTGALTLGTSDTGQQLLFLSGLTLANDIQGSSDLTLGATGSTASLTLTGGIHTHLDYLGSGTLTYAGTNPHLGSLTTDEAATPNVIYAREEAQADGVYLSGGNLAINADTGISLLRAAAGTTVQIADDKTLTLDYNSYGEGPVIHEVLGVVSGAGTLRLDDNDAVLTGANTFTGGLELLDATVGFTRTDALGAGEIRVQGESTGGLWVLAPDFTVANPIAMEDGARLRVGGGTGFGYDDYDTPGNRNLTLTGVISGNGGLSKESNNTLTLTGQNTFAGDISILGGTVVFTTAETVGSGSNRLFLGYNYYEGAAHVRFLAGNPVVGGISDTSYYESSGSTITLGDGVALTIGVHNDGGAGNQYYLGSITGDGSLIKDGLAVQTLGGASDYTGGTTIKQGALIAGHNQAFGTGDITVDGGRLGADSGIAFTNQIIFGAGGGALTGNGTFTQPLTIGLGVGLAPGYSPGTMTFSDLTLAGGGFLEFEIQDPTQSAGYGYDSLQVNGTLNITATPGNRYSINIYSLNWEGGHGVMELADPLAPFTLTLASAGSITGFDAASFSLNANQFTTNFDGYYDISFTQSGNSLQLNFTPVPEPSTYALLALGVGLLWFARRRR